MRVGVLGWYDLCKVWLEGQVCVCFWSCCCELGGGCGVGLGGELGEFSLGFVVVVWGGVKGMGWWWDGGFFRVGGVEDSGRGLQFEFCMRGWGCFYSFVVFRSC